jgi:uncharacterized protein YciI
MPHYFLKIIPCRPTFAFDMTDDERAIMQRHVVYLGGLMDKGKMVVYGPVMDPKGPYGMGVVEVENEYELSEIIKNDPAASINVYEYYPMRAVTPANK